MPNKARKYPLECSLLAVFVLTSTTLATEPDASNPPESEGPRIVVVPGKVEFGDVSPQASPKDTFAIANAGDEELTVTRFSSSCFCTLVENKAYTLQPGDTVEVPIQLDLSEYGSNTVRSYITLESNAVGEPATRVEVTANVIPELLMEPSEIDFGRVKKGSTVAEAVFVRRNGIENIEVKEVKTTDGLATAIREVDGDYAVVVQYRPSLNATRLNGAITVVTNIERIPEIRVPVRARVVGIESEIEPKVLVFDDGKAGTPIGVVEITGTPDLRLLKTKMSDSHFTSTHELLPDNSGHRVVVSVAEGAQSGDVFATLELQLQEGELVETRKVTVFGTIE